MRGAGRMAKGNEWMPPLAVAVLPMWGTPTGQDAIGSEWSSDGKGGKLFKLNGQVKLWPTPAARDYRAPNNPNGASRLSRPPTSGDQLPNAVGGVLSPDWVERLMGYPPGWTELDQWKPGKATRRAR